MTLNYNRVMFAGNLTIDPVMGANGQVANFSIACNRRYKTKEGEQKEEVTYLDCEAWGKTGETIAQYFTKAKPIFVEGRLKNNSWVTSNGEKRQRIIMTVESFQFADGPRVTQDAPAEAPRAPKPVASGIDDEPPF